MALDLGAIVEARDPNRAKRRRKGRRMRGVGSRRTDEIAYRRELVQLSKFVATAAEEQLFALLERLESQFTRDSTELQVVDAFGEEIDNAFRSIRAQFASIESFAQTRADQMAGRVDAAHARRHFEQVKQTVGVDLRGIVNEERLQSVLRAKTQENVGLIKSIPEQHFQKLESIVFEGTIRGNSAKSIQQQIRELGKVTERRARFIARDQTAKLNSALNTERNLALGIEEYIWRTSLDKRVRDNHASKEGKKFRFDSPPADTGAPGEDFNCRCTAQSIVPDI